MNPPSSSPAAPAPLDASGDGAAPTVHAQRLRLGDLVELTKARITFMVILTTAVGFILAGSGTLALGLFFHTLAATALVASGASALNQVIEREHDARMRRTAQRPIPSGRLNADHALLVGVSLAIAGVVYLALAVNLLTALVGAASLAGYVFIYTPMKRVSSLSTIVGAVPGALPPVMGWTAVRDSLDPGAWALFGILFLWQLPHFLAIAWMCREDYERAGFPMLSVIDRDGTRSGRQAVLWAAALIPLSLMPTVLGLTGGVYLTGTLILGLLYLAAAILFGRRRNRSTARRLLLTSVLYLPAILAVMLLDRVSL